MGLLCPTSAEGVEERGGKTRTTLSSAEEHDCWEGGDRERDKGGDEDLADGLCEEASDVDGDWEYSRDELRCLADVLLGDRL